MEATQLPEETVARRLTCQRWGVCDAGTADICGVDSKPVQRFQTVAAQRAPAHHDQVTRDLRVGAVQLDERHAKRRGSHVEWRQTAMAMSRRVVRWVHGGPRTQERAALLMAPVVARWCGVPVWRSAGWKAYPAALLQVLGQVDRRRRGSSASPRRHRARVWLVVDLDTFVLPHRRLRQEGRPRTPAMATELAPHVWSDRDDIWSPVHPDPLDRQLRQQRVKDLLGPALEAE